MAWSQIQKTPCAAFRSSNASWISRTPCQMIVIGPDGEGERSADELVNEDKSKRDVVDW